MKRITLQRLRLYAVVFFSVLSINSASALDYYWVGGTGAWSDLSHWATTSGGAVNHIIVPSPLDNVNFDGNSFPATGGTVTLSFEGFCNNFTVASNLNPGVTFQFNTGLNISGSLSALPSANKLTWNQSTKLIIGSGAVLDNVFLNMTNGEFRIQTGNLDLQDQAYFKKQGWVDPCHLDNGTILMVSGSKYEQYDGYFIAGNGSITVPSGATFRNNAHNKEIKNGGFYAEAGSSVYIGRTWIITNGGYVLDIASTLTFTDQCPIYLRSTITGSYNIGSGGRNIYRVQLDGANNNTQYHLVDDLTALSDGLFMYSNQFFSGGHEIYVYHFYNWDCGITKIDVTGTSLIKVISQFRLTYCPANLTLNMGTADILMEGHDHQYVIATGKTLNNIHFNSLSTGDIQIFMEGTFNANNIKITGNGRQYLRMHGVHTINNFTYNLINASVNNNIQQELHANNTFTGDFTFSAAEPNTKPKWYFGTSSSYKKLDFNNDISEWQIAPGSTQTFTDLVDLTGTCAQTIFVHTGSTTAQATFSQASGSFTGDWLKLQSIRATGGASWSAINTIDLGNNTGWTISGVPAQTFYWIGGTGNWNDPNHWSLSSGGAPGCAIPSRIDNVMFDANSFTAAGQSCNVNITNAECYNMTWDNVVVGSGWSGGNRLYLYGNICKFDANMVDGKGEWIFFRNNTATGTTIETEGKVLNTALYFEAQFTNTPTWKLLDDLKSNTWIQVHYGKFISNGKNLDVFAYWTSDNGTTSDFTGSTLIKLQYQWRLWNNSTLILPSTCEIVMSSANHMYFQSYGTSTANRKTYSKITFDNINTGGTEVVVQGAFNNYGDMTLNHNGDGRFYMENSEIIVNDLKVNYYRDFDTKPNVQIHTNNMTTASFKVTGSGKNRPRIEMPYNNSYGNADLLNISSFAMWPGYTRTFSNLNITSACNPKAVISSVSPGVPAALSVSGAASCDNCVIQDINATGIGTYSSSNSVIAANVAGWPAGSGINLYWIGGTGNWNDVNHWSFVPGGTPAGCLPTRVDNVFFDVNSFTAPNQVVTIQNNVECKNMLWNNVNNPIVNGGDVLQVFGSLILAPNVTWNHANWVFFQSRNTGNVINTNGVPLRYIMFNGEGTYEGEWKLQGDLRARNYIYFRSGDFYTNGYGLEALALWNDHNDIRIKMDFTGTPEVKIHHQVHFYPACDIQAANTDFRFFQQQDGAFRFYNYGKTVKNVIMDAGGSAGAIEFHQAAIYNNVTINTTVWPTVYFHHGGVYNDIDISYNNSTTNIPQVQFNSNTVVNNLNVSSTGNGGPHLFLNQNNTFNNLIVAGLGTRLYIGANRTQTVNGLLALGNGSFPVLFQSTSSGTQGTIYKPSGTVCLDFVVMKDVKGNGLSNGMGGIQTAYFAGASSVNLGNNTNWAFTSCGAYYWVGDNGNWSDYANHWATSSGGTTFHSSAPGPGDDVYFDANSFTTTGRVVTVDVATAKCRNMKWSSATFNPTFAGTGDLEIYGDLELISAMNQNYTGTWKFMAADNGHTLNSSGKTFVNASFIGGGSGLGEWTLSNPLSVSNDLNFDNGTLKTNNKNISTKNFNSGTGNTRSLQLGSSTVTITNGSWNPSTLTDAQLVEGTSTILVTGNAASSFLGNGLMYNNVTFTTPSNLTASMTGTNTFNVLRVDKGLTLNVRPGLNTMSSLVADGDCGNFITIQSSLPGTQAQFIKLTGTVNASFLNLKDMLASGGATWNANFSNDVGNNTGWNFTSPPNVLITTSSTSVNCQSNNNGSASVSSVSGGVAPYTYLWSTTETTPSIANLIPGTYMVTVTDATGCKAFASVNVVNEPSAVTAVPFTMSASQICLGNTINFTAGTPAQPVSGYLWNFGDFTSSNSQNASRTYTAAGNYTVTLSYYDASGCPANTSAMVSISSVSASIIKTNVSCFGKNDGSIVVNASGGVSPLEYSINNGSSWHLSQSFTGLAPAIYPVKVRDAIGCTIPVSSQQITQPASALGQNISYTDPTCAGGDGSIMVVASGGTSPYTYSINNGILFVASGNFQNLNPGTYNVLVRDANNCRTNAQQVVLSAGAEVAVIGNGNIINDGDATPSFSDHTDFGLTGIGSFTTRTFTIENNGSGTLHVTSITISGSNPGNFVVTGISLPATINSGNSATFNITFSAGSNGIFDAVVNINNGDCDESVYNYAVRGEVNCTPPQTTDCRSAVVANTFEGACSVVVNYPAAFSGSPAPGVSYSFSGATSGSGTGTGSGSSFKKGLTHVIVTATNSCGSATCEFTVTVEDHEAPMIACASDVTIDCDKSTMPSNTGTSTASDNCGSAEVTYNDVISPGNCPGNYSIARTWKAVDASGNSSSCTQLITVTDDVVPFMSAPASDIYVECDGSGNTAQLNAWLADHGGGVASDVCSGVTWTNSSSALSDDCGNTGSATVTFVATDACGNYVKTTATFTIVDTRPPTITAASNETVECDGAGNTAQLNAWLGNNGGATASDICGGVTWSNNFTALSDECGATGFVTVTFTATDDCENRSHTTATFRIVDVTAPTITTAASDLTVECDGSGNTAQLNAWLADHGGGVATDVCSGVTWTNSSSALSDDCGNTGSATVTFVATDACGNFVETTATFTIVDTRPPTITAASNETVECDGAGNTAQLNAWLGNNGGATASDICGGVTWSNNFTALSDDCGATGFVTVTFTATDDCENRSHTTATFRIVDVTAPTITTAASDLTVECDGSGNTAQLNAWLADHGGGVATDVCSGVTWTNSSSALSDDCGNTGSATVTFVATDACGNFVETTATFTIVDTRPPTITAASNETVECDGAGNTAQLNAWLGNNGGATASDICGGVTWSNNFTALSDDCGATGFVTVTFTATDDCENRSHTTATFRIVDVTAPTITTAASDLTVECDGSGNTAQLNAWLADHGGAVASDVCSGVTWTNSSSALSDDCGNTGSATVTFVATDACGNYVKTTATFTIVDLTPPTVQCPANIIKPNDIGECGAKVNFAAAASDVCGSAQVTYDVPPGSFFPVGTTTVTITATDECGNKSNCSFTVTVVDNELPKAQCKNITITLAGGSASITPADINNGSTDNCHVQSVTISKSTFDCTNLGSNQVTLTVTDDAGLVSTCFSTVTVMGSLVNCNITAIPANSTYTGGVPTNIYLGYGPQSVTLKVNPSGGAPFTYSWTGTGSLSCSNCAAPVFTPTTPGIYNFTVTVTNQYGCKTTCSITICVLDIRVPGSNGKVYICHIPPGNPGNPQTLSVSVNAVPSHIPGHDGDRLGSCAQVPCTPIAAPVFAGSRKGDAEVDPTSHHFEFGVKVSPNPSNTDFKIQVMSETDEPVSIRLTDASGRVVEYLKNLSKASVTSVGKALRGGTYFADIRQGINHKVIKLIKLN